MRCRKVEKILLLSEENELSTDEQQKFMIHISSCPQCRRFQERTRLIRMGLGELPDPGLPEDVEDRTRALCHSVLKEVSARKGLRTRVQQPVPRLIWGILAAITMLTFVWAWPVLKDLNIEDPSLKELLVLGIIIQNFMMLLFSPLLLFRHSLERSRIGAV